MVNGVALSGDFLKLEKISGPDVRALVPVLIDPAKVSVTPALKDSVASASGSAS